MPYPANVVGLPVILDQDCAGTEVRYPLPVTQDCVATNSLESPI